jgi:hypothetical protein
MLSAQLRKIAKRVNGIEDITDYSDQVDPIADTALFSIGNIQEVMNQFKTEIKAPFVSVDASRIGGPARATIMLLISLDPRETWSNGIMENSRYGRFSVYRDGTVDQFTYHPRSLKSRKMRGKSIDHIISKLNQWVVAMG